MGKTKKVDMLKVLKEMKEMDDLYDRVIYGIEEMEMERSVDNGETR